MSDQGKQGKRQRLSRQDSGGAEGQRAHEQDVDRSQAEESGVPDPHLLQAIQQGSRDATQESHAALVGPVVDALREHTVATRGQDRTTLGQTPTDETTPTPVEQDIIDQYTVLQMILEKPVPLGGRAYNDDVVRFPPDFEENPARDFAPLPDPPLADWKPTIPTIDLVPSTPPAVLPPHLDFGLVPDPQSGNPVTRTVTVTAGSEPMAITSMRVIGPNADHFPDLTSRCPVTIQPGETCNVEVTSRIPDPHQGFHDTFRAQLLLFVTTSREPLTVSLEGNEPSDIG